MLEMTQGEPRSNRWHKLTVPALAGSARQARHWLASLELGLEPHKLESLQLLASELVTNSVRHAGLAPGDGLDLELHVRPGRVRLEVTDCGGGFDPQDHVTPGVDSGFGLFFVQEIASRWGTSSNGETRVWFELNVGAARKAATPPAAVAPQTTA